MYNRLFKRLQDTFFLNGDTVIFRDEWNELDKIDQSNLLMSDYDFIIKFEEV